MRYSLRTQISLTIIAIVLFTVAIVSFFSNQFIRQKFEDYIVEQQRMRTLDIVALLENRYDETTEKWDTDFIHGVGMYALSEGYIIKLNDRNNVTIWDAENHDMSLCSQVMNEISARMEKKRPDFGGSFISEVYELDQKGQQVGMVSIGYYSPYFLTEHDFQFLDDLNLVLFSIGVLSLLLSFAAGTVLARWIARPIAKTAYISKQISDGNYAIRFEGKIKTKELDELVSAVNHLADALDVQEALRKRLTEDVAHELRTPLTTVASHLEAIIEGVWEPTPERLQGCYEEIGRLSGLVADLEHLARVEGDNLNLIKCPVDLMDIAHWAVEHFHAELKKKGIAIVIKGQSAIVLADRNRISQVMTNLLSNAIKYTHNQGMIHIVVKNEDDHGLLIVEDNGIGMAEEKLPLIFERFYRTDESRNRRTGGAGIGLAIVKSIVTAHDGEITAESQLGRGSRFFVKIPKS